MNFRKRGAALPQFQMTAMMDIVFLLLCFFITSSVYSQWENEVNLTLPSAKSGQPTTRLPGEIILNVAQDGVVTVNQRSFQGEELRELLTKVATYLPGQPVILRVDKKTAYEDFVRVVDMCREVGIAEFSLATIDAPAVVSEPPEGGLPSEGTLPPAL